MIDQLPSEQEINILLVEDSLGDVRLTKEALKEGGVEGNLSVVSDGVEALDFLFRRGRFTDSMRPDLILLDLNLPRKDGREVLIAIKNDEDLCRIPVVVLTTSKLEEDIENCYRLHANCFITKPVDFERFIEVIKTLTDFWFKIACIPGRSLA